VANGVAVGEVKAELGVFRSSVGSGGMARQLDLAIDRVEPHLSTIVVIELATRLEGELYAVTACIPRLLVSVRLNDSVEFRGR
jgi:hypothetical protein